MNRILTLNENDFEPKDYVIRKVVRLVILNTSNDKVLFFGNNLVGGGVEEGETDEGAIHREVMEEAGATVVITQELGEIVSYRDFLKRKYIVHGYICKQIGDLQDPTTLDQDEQNTSISWLSIPEAKEKLEREIITLENERKTKNDDDTFQKRIYNRKIALAFLKKAF